MSTSCGCPVSVGALSIGEVASVQVVAAVGFLLFYLLVVTGHAMQINHPWPHDAPSAITGRPHGLRRCFFLQAATLPGTGFIPAAGRGQA